MKFYERMKHTLEQHPLTPAGFWLAAAAVFLAKALLASRQMFYTWIGGAPLDDELYFALAQSVSAGQWLGEYGYLTLSKHPLFALWLALLDKLELPYLIMGQMLWCAAALACARALAPVLACRWRQLAVFAAMAFLPSASAAPTLRVYRDNIFPALCMFFFAGLVGYALRAAKPLARTLPWLVMAGCGLAAAWLCREDGIWLLPFLLAGGVVLCVLLARRYGAGHRLTLTRTLALVLPAVILWGSLAGVKAKNEQMYGVSVVSDFSGGSFADAIGAMVRVKESRPVELVSIPAEVRQLLYAHVEALQPLEYWLEEDPQMRNDFVNPALGDYQSGSFYWAIRRAAGYEGIYDSAETAEAYWAGVAAEINALCDSGVLPAEGGVRSGTAPPIRPENVLPTLAEFARSIVYCVTFRGCAPYESGISIGTAEDIAVWEDYLNTKCNLAAQAGTALAYYGPVQKLAFFAFGVLQGLYSVALPVAFVCALWVFLRRGLALRRTGGALLWWLQLGLLGMALLRAAMISFMEVASFNIGTYVMYLATVHPLLLLFTLAVLLAKNETGENAEWDI